MRWMWPSPDGGVGLGTVNHLPPPKCRCLRSVRVAGGCFGESSAFLQHARVIQSREPSDGLQMHNHPRGVQGHGMSSQYRCPPGQACPCVWVAPRYSPALFLLLPKHGCSKSPCQKMLKAFICSPVQTSYHKWFPSKFWGALSVLKSG